MVAVLLALLGLGGLALGVVAGEVGLLLVGSPLLLVAAMLVYLSRGRRPGGDGLEVREVPELGERGIVLPYSAGLGWGYVVASAYSLVFFGLLAVGGLVTEEVNPVLPAVALLICAYLLWCAVDLLRGRLRAGWVALTPRGIYHRSWAMHAYLPWTDVIGVFGADAHGPLVQLMAAANTSGWVRRTSWAWRQGELAFAPHLAVQGRFLAGPPELLYRAARFYHENPSARVELGDARGVSRIRGMAGTAPT